MGLPTKCHALLALLGLIPVIAGCARQSDLDAANSKLAKATTDLATANEQLAEANKSIEDLKAQVAALQPPSEPTPPPPAVKPRLPVSWIVRKAFAGPGLMIVLNSAAKEPLKVLVTIRNPSLGTTKEVELPMFPSGSAMLGSAQGAVIDPGDVISLSNADYSTLEFTVR
jgi:hypothetical protein